MGVPSHFTIKVAGGDDAELAVSVQGKENVSCYLLHHFKCELFCRPTEISYTLVEKEWSYSDVKFLHIRKVKKVKNGEESKSFLDVGLWICSLFWFCQPFVREVYKSLK